MDVDLEFGAMNLFVGLPTRAAMSNFFDALRVLQGVGNGYSVSEILDGKPRSVTNEVWEGIRGGQCQVVLRDGARAANTRSDVLNRHPRIASRVDDGRGTTPSTDVPTSAAWVQNGEPDGCRRADGFGSKAQDTDTPVHDRTVTLTGKKGRPPLKLAFERSRPALRPVRGCREGVRSKTCGTSMQRSLEQLARHCTRDRPGSPSSHSAATRNAAIVAISDGRTRENFAALDPQTSASRVTRRRVTLAWLRELRPQRAWTMVATLRWRCRRTDVRVAGERGRQVSGTKRAERRHAALCVRSRLRSSNPTCPTIMTI